MVISLIPHHKILLSPLSDFFAMLYVSISTYIHMELFESDSENIIFEVK